MTATCHRTCLPVSDGAKLAPAVLIAVVECGVDAGCHDAPVVGVCAVDAAAGQVLLGSWRDDEVRALGVFHIPQLEGEGPNLAHTNLCISTLSPSIDSSLMHCKSVFMTACKCTQQKHDMYALKLAAVLHTCSHGVSVTCQVKMFIRCQYGCRRQLLSPAHHHM